MDKPVDCPVNRKVVFRIIKSCYRQNGNISLISGIDIYELFWQRNSSFIGKYGIEFYMSAGCGKNIWGINL